MVKHKKRFIARPRQKLIDLDRQDTSETGNVDSGSSKRSDGDPEYVKVPLFKGDSGDRAITWGDLSYTWKVTVLICSLFAAIGIPTIYFASDIVIRVGNIENDVREIKQITKNLTETTIKNSSKIENLEKNFDSISGAASAPKK